MTTVVHCRRAPYDVYIGRPSRWGNPFQIGLHGTRAQVIDRFHVWVLEQRALLEQLPSLRGRVLGCWCTPHACHGDVLARLADSELGLEASWRPA